MHLHRNAIPPSLMNIVRLSRRAFTIIELLAVIGIITVVIVFAVPAANSIMRGSQLSQGSQALSDQLGFARQLALSKNRAIEVRFYRFGDPETPGEDDTDPETGKWRAFQLFQVLDNGATVPEGEMKRLPRIVVMDPNEYSTLLSEDYRGKPKKGADDTTAPELPIRVGEREVGRNYDYLSFRFLPDGSTDLPARAKKIEAGTTTTSENDTWYVTLVSLGDDGKDIGQINYFTLQLDPISGTTKSFRPNGS
jgi:uncharacterized protein (TIGR02596 family)